MPLFITVTFDAGFEISPSIYRYLTILAFANSSIMPYCYLTILIPCINKYCFSFLRTDGKISNEKTAYYNAVESYYEKLGDRLHNGSNHSSDLELNKKLVEKAPESVVKETSFYERPPPLKYVSGRPGSISFDDNYRSARRSTLTANPARGELRSKALLDRSLLNLVESCHESGYPSGAEYEPRYEKASSSVNYTPILGLRSSQPTPQRLRVLRQMSLTAYDSPMEPVYAKSQSRMRRSTLEHPSCQRDSNILEVDYI